MGRELSLVWCLMRACIILVEPLCSAPQLVSLLMELEALMREGRRVYVFSRHGHGRIGVRLLLDPPIYTPTLLGTRMRPLPHTCAYTSALA